MLDDDGRLRVGSDGDDDVTVGHLVALTVGVDDRGPIELRVSRHRVVRDDGCAVGCDDGGAVLGFEDAELLGGFERDLLDRQAGRQICVDAQTSVSGLIGEEVAELADRREAPFLFAAVRDREVRGVKLRVRSSRFEAGTWMSPPCECSETPSGLVVSVTKTP